MRKGSRKGGAVVAVLVGIVLAGCYEHTLTVGDGAPQGPVVYDHWENFWLGGLIGHVRVDAEDICPSGDATVVAKQTFLNGLVAALTAGVYTPTTLEVRCRGGRRARLDLSGDEVEQIVHDPLFRAWVERDLPERVQEVDAVLDRRADG